MRLTVHEQIPEDEILRHRWNQLVIEMESPQVFYTYEWVRAVAAAYQDTIGVRLFTAYEDRELVGVAALASDVSRRKVFFLAGATADYCDFISRPVHRQEFISRVFERLKQEKLDDITLANLPADSSTVHCLVGCMRDFGLRIFSRPAYDCFQLRFNTPEQRAAVRQRVTGAKGLRYALKSAAKRGAVKFSHLTKSSEIAPYFDEYCESHVARFISVGLVSNLADMRRRNFLFHLGQELSPSNSIAFSCMFIDSHAIAWNYGFRFAGSWFYYQPTFRTDYSQFSPGSCLLSSIVSDACEDESTSVVDLGLGSEQYKARFANASRRTVHVTMTQSVMRRNRVALRFHAASAIKSRPRLERGVRRVLGLWPGAKIRKQLRAAG